MNCVGRPTRPRNRLHRQRQSAGETGRKLAWKRKLRPSPAGRGNTRQRSSTGTNGFTVVTVASYNPHEAQRNCGMEDYRLAWSSGPARRSYIRGQAGGSDRRSAHPQRATRLLATFPAPACWSPEQRTTGMPDSPEAGEVKSSRAATRRGAPARSRRGERSQSPFNSLHCRRGGSRLPARGKRCPQRNRQ
jgi:hypothetical protein